MQVRRQNPNQSNQSKKIRKLQNQYTKSESSQFVIDSQLSESSEDFIQMNQRKQNSTGRRETNDFEKPRRKYKSNPNVALNQLFNVKSLGTMQIFKKLFDSVESHEILDFLGDCRPFLKIIKLLIQDNPLNLDLSSFDGVDFTKDFLYETVPRTFINGLMKLKESRQIEKNEQFIVAEKEVKAMYIGCLLFIGIGQIHKKYKTQLSNESSKTYFHRLVTFLLDESKFLTPKLFYYISGNWDKIIQMIRDQLRTDENEPLRPKNCGQNINQGLDRLRIEDSDQINQVIDQESFENIKWGHERGSDVEIKFLSESKPKQTKTESQSNNFNPEAETQNFKRSKPTVAVKGSIQCQKKVKLNYSDPVVQKAIKQYNFDQYNTRDRSRRMNQKIKSIEQVEKVEIENEEEKREIISEEKCEVKPQMVSLQTEDFFLIDSDFENFFEDKEEKYSMKRKGSVSSVDEFFSETFKSSTENDENIQSSSELIFSNHQDQTEEERNQMEVEEENKEVQNPNRKVRHEKREIDYMIKEIIDDRFVMIQAISNEIYHALKVVNAKLPDFPRQGFARNLARDFEQL